jgi:hypothetical protein
VSLPAIRSFSLRSGRPQDTQQEGRQHGDRLGSHGIVDDGMNGDQSKAEAGCTRRQRGLYDARAPGAPGPGDIDRRTGDNGDQPKGAAFKPALQIA